MPDIERKLAAIMVADIVGYSAMMERDESRTFASAGNDILEFGAPTWR